MLFQLAASSLHSSAPVYCPKEEQKYGEKQKEEKDDNDKKKKEGKKQTNIPQQEVGFPPLQNLSLVLPQDKIQFPRSKSPLGN